MSFIPSCFATSAFYGDVFATLHLQYLGHREVAPLVYSTLGAYSNCPLSDYLISKTCVETIFCRADGANQVSCMSNSCQPEKPNRAKSSQVGKGRDHDRIPREDIGASLDS